MMNYAAYPWGMYEYDYLDIEGCFEGIKDPFDILSRLSKEEQELLNFCLNREEKVVAAKGDNRYKICVNRVPDVAACGDCENWSPAYPCARNEDIAAYKLKKRTITAELIKRFRATNQLFAKK